MKELLEYRMNLTKRLEDSAKAFREACLAMPDPYAPLEKGGWNVHQIAVHLRDTDKLIFGLRARRTAMEDNPEFSPFDSDVYMAEHYDASEPLSNVLNEFVASIEALVKLLRSLAPEGWSRLSRHTTLGQGLTLQSWVEKDLAHLEEHLETLQKTK